MESHVFLGSAGDATITFQGDNERAAIHDGILRMRRALWRVESALKILESSRFDSNLNPAQKLHTKRQFSAMFNASLDVMDEFYGLTLGYYGEKIMLSVIQDFHQRFDYLRKFR